MGEENNATFTVESVEKDGAVVMKSPEGETVRYVKESDLLSVKGGKESAEKAVKDAEAARGTAAEEANRILDAEKQRALQAEARVSSLEEQIAKGGGDAAVLAKTTADLEAAKTSSEALGNKYLELKRSTIIATYKVPKETVENKDLAALDVFEEALKAVIGNKDIGNFAAGAGGGGASSLEGKSPQQLAVEAYSQSNVK